MAENTKIQWCDHTFNPFRGCVKVATGCVNCYAEAQSKRNPKVLGIWGSEASGATRVVAAEEQWRQVKRWNDAAACLRTFDCANGDHSDACPQKNRPSVFVASLADWAEDWQGPMVDAKGRRLFWSHSRHPSDSKWHWVNEQHCAGGEQPVTMDDVRARLFAMEEECQNLIFMMLTKRPENIRRYIPHRLDNVWLYTSIACQEDADRNIPELLKCRDLAPVIGVSAEPLVGQIDFGTPCRWAATSERWGVNHVIVGGESGPNARPCNVEWIRDIVQQCRAAGVACFVKQLGARVVDDGANNQSRSYPEEQCWPDSVCVIHRLGMEYIPLLDKKGSDPSEWPDDLQVREVPHAS